jgi:hypothetical protein
MLISDFAALLFRRSGSVNAFLKALMAVILDERPVGFLGDVFRLCHG